LRRWPGSLVPLESKEVHQRLRRDAKRRAKRDVDGNARMLGVSLGDLRRCLSMNL